MKVHILAPHERHSVCGLQWAKKGARFGTENTATCKNCRRGRSLQRQNEDAEWIRGFATALAEIHRLLAGGNNSEGVCEIARNAGLSLKGLERAGLSDFDLRELRKAGVP